MEDERSRIVPSSRVPAAIFWAGVLLFILYFADNIYFDDMRVDLLFTGPFMVDLGLSLVYSLGIVVAARRLQKSNFSEERHPRIAKWFLVGMALFVLIDLPHLIVWSPSTPESFVGGMRRSAALGGLCGLVFGIIEARAIRRETIAERESIRAEAADAQRRRLSYLNALLRHEVLNTIQVISGYSAKALNEDDLDEGVRGDIETIQRRAEGMSEVIRDMQVLIKATQEAGEMTAVNLTEVLESELKDLQEVAADVEVEASIPDDVFVEADDLLHRVFANIFMNAVEHNDSEIPRIDVSVERDADTVVVSIADNGPGIPDSERDTLFEANDTPSGTHGLGLYLVRTLIERYDGEVRLSDSGTHGSTFTVELPRAPDREPRSAPSTADAAA